MRRTGIAPGLLSLGSLALAFGLGAGPGSSGLAAQEDARALGAAEVLARWHARLDGRRFIANVALEMELAGQSETRDLRVFRDDPGGKGERVLIKFSSPPTLRNLGLLYIEEPDGPNTYYLYQPDARRLRRLPESIADEDVYGIDLEFLGFGGVSSVPVELVSMSREALGGHPVYRIQQRASEPNTRFDERVVWIDAESFVARRTEHRFEGEPSMVAETDETESVGGVVFPTRMTFRSGRGLDQRVTLRVSGLDLTSPIPDEFFSVVSLTRRGRLPGSR